MKKIISLHGSYFYNNYGDTLLVNLFASWIKEALPDSEINLPIANRRKIWEMPGEKSGIINLCKSHALVFCGGGYFGELARASVSLPFWASIGYLSIVSSIAAFMLYNYSTTVISTVRSASFSNIITVVSVLAGILILGEFLSIPQLICCVLIVIGVLGVNR